MTDTSAIQPAGAASADGLSSRGLLSRALGVVFAPRATYAAIAARPRAAGALLTVIAILAAGTLACLSTDVGRTAALDQQMAAMESFGVQLTPERLEMMERRSASAPYVAIVAQAVTIPLISLVMAGIALAVFTAALGGDATLRQVYAVVVHSWFIPALATVFVIPLNYAQQSLTSPTRLAVFFPMLDPAGFAGRLLGSIDLLRIRRLISLAIGLGVLYKRKTGPIAGVMLALYFTIALIVAAVMTTLSGA